MSITPSTTGPLSSSVDQATFLWTYINNDIEEPNKCLRIDLDGSTISFVDTWGLYTPSSMGISKDQATAIAWNAAKNYNLTLTREDNSSYIVQPDWTNMTSTVNLSMVPGQIYNGSLSEQLGLVTAGNKTRDPLTLYPLWQFVFYFSQNIGDAVGIQVGVCGDTKEIAYCGPYGFLGNPDYIPTQTPLSSDSAQPSIESSMPNSLGEPATIAAIVIVCISAVAVGVYVIKRKK
jgi:hypothetical protein